MLLVSRSNASYHHGNLQSALEDAALSLLETQPAARISLREVARRAGVSHNAPYHHFGDRAALLHALGVRAMRELLEAQEAAVEAATGPVDRVRALGAAYVGYAADHPQSFALVFDPEYCPPGDPAADMAPLITRNEELLARRGGRARAGARLPGPGPRGDGRGPVGHRARDGRAGHARAPAPRGGRAGPGRAGERGFLIASRYQERRPTLDGI